MSSAVSPIPADDPKRSLTVAQPHNLPHLGLVGTGGPPLTTFACPIPTEGAPSLRFLQGWAAMLRVLFDFCCGHVIKPIWRGHLRIPPFAKKREGWDTHCVGNAHKSKAWATRPRNRAVPP